MNESNDLITYLLQTPFSSLSFEEKCALKDKRPQPLLKIVQKDGHQVRTFQSQWYNDYSWLTASVTECKFYCYICLLFGGDSEWNEVGISTLKNFHRRARKHQISKRHILNSERFLLLGRSRIEHALSEAARLGAQKHNELVKHNRRVVGRLVQVVCFLGKQELPFRGHDESSDSVNKGNYLETLELLAQEERFMGEHLEATSGFKGTSSDIQNELIDCVTQVMNEEIQKELSICEFVSVQADETLDISCQNQMNIILRCCVGYNVHERFVGFYDVSKDKSAKGLSAVILDALRKWGVENKLICQTYDGASVMAGSTGGVQAIIKQVCPHAIFIHCYAHKLNLVLLYGSKSIKRMRIFTYDLTAFHTYFSQSSKRTQVLRSKGFKLPQACTTRWNFHSRATLTIASHFRDLKEALTHIVDKDEEWDGESVNGAIGLVKRLDDPNFLFLLCFFNKIFCYTDHLFKVLQAKCTSNVNICNHEIKLTINNLKNLRNEETVRECIDNSKALNNTMITESFVVPTLRALAYEIIDTTVVQMEIRFSDFENFHFAELLDENQFKAYNKSFPSMKLKQLLKMYPFFDCEQLRNELLNVYSDEAKHLPPQILLKYLLDNGLDTVYQQTTRLVRLVLTFPVTTCSSERSMSALKRIKTFLRNSMTNNRLSNLSTLAIEKSLLHQLSNNQSFRDRVIDTFAERKERRIPLIYKKI